LWWPVHRVLRVIEGSTSEVKLTSKRRARKGRVTASRNGVLTRSDQGGQLWVTDGSRQQRDDVDE
jgi:hypothetical protein